MNGPADADLLPRLRALRVPPPDNGFELRLRRRLEAEPAPAPARSAAVIPLARWLRNRRVVIALAAAAFPLAVFAAAGGYLPGFGSPATGASGQSDEAQEQRAAPRVAPPGPARSSGPRKLETAPGTDEKGQAAPTKQRVQSAHESGSKASSGQRSSEPDRSGVRSKRAESARAPLGPEDRNATEPSTSSTASQVEKPPDSPRTRATERLQIRVRPGPSASARGTAPRLRERLRSSGPAEHRRGAEAGERSRRGDRTERGRGEGRDRAERGRESRSERERGPKEERGQMRAGPR